ncbi:YoaK family protein [soil metagenome]
MQALAICLAALAGYIDAVAFLETRGFFVSFMSGNTTRLGAAIALHTGSAAVAAGLIAIFIAGVAGGSLAGHFAKNHRRSSVLSFVAALLFVASCCASIGAQAAAIAILTLAMGAENTVFEQDGEIQIGLTYMTGTLVKLGQRLAAMLRGGDRTGWVSYLLLWLGLLGGGTTGAALYGYIGLFALWPATAGAAFLVVFSVFAENAQTIDGSPKKKRAR